MRRRILVLVVILAFLWPAHMHAAIVYDLIDLGTLGERASAALSINDAGQIVGEADDHATLFDPTGAGNNIDLGTLGGVSSSAWSINNAGQIVGYAQNSQGDWRATLFDSTGAGNNLDLGTLGGNDSFAYSINDAGQIVGPAQYVPGEAHATSFDPTGAGRNLNLGAPGSEWSEAWSINDAGKIVGRMDGRAALFEPTGAGNNIDLGTLGGDYSEALSINDAGQIAGSARNSQDDWHATLFDSTGAGNNIDLGTLGGRDSEAKSINNAGQIVGSAENKQGDWRATMFDPTGAGNNIDLNTLIDHASGWTVVCAYDINASGWIVGKGDSSQGKSHAFLLVPASTKYGGGTGEPNDPYLIYTAEQMNAIGTNSKDWDKHFKLMADIDLSAFTGVEFNIIGYWNCYIDNHPFTGLFDGNGYTIKNFTYATQIQDYVGLFGCLGIGGEIKGLALKDANINTDGHFVAGLVGWNVFGTIVNCYVTGSVGGWTRVGGLVGRNCGFINNCYSTANIFGEDDVGCLVGWNDFGAITNCHATGSTMGDNRVGGLVGPNWGLISNCYSAASIIGRRNTIGGLVGENELRGTITECHSTSSVETEYDSEQVGGLVGENSATITNCYVSGSVRGHWEVGGLVGHNDDDSMVSHCYSTGRIFGDHDVGGLVGYNDGGANVLASFWDTQTTNQSGGIGFDEGGGTINIFGLTTVEMMQQATFTSEGWDFVGETENGTEDIWWILEGQDYPRLWWETE